MKNRQIELMFKIGFGVLILCLVYLYGQIQYVVGYEFGRAEVLIKWIEALKCWGGEDERNWS